MTRQVRANNSKELIMNLSLRLELIVARWVSVTDHVVCVMEMLQPEKLGNKEQ